MFDESPADHAQQESRCSECDYGQFYYAWQKIPRCEAIESNGAGLCDKQLCSQCGSRCIGCGVRTCGEHTCTINDSDYCLVCARMYLKMAGYEGLREAAA